MRKLVILCLTAMCCTFSLLPVHAQSRGMTETRTIGVNGATRSYLIHLPPNAGTGALLPLVIALHGGGGNPEQFAKDTQFNPLADQENFIVVYPHGTGLLGTWDAIHCCGQAYDKQVDDVGFISALIDALIQSDHVDPKRVYATGHSNGGMMTYRLGAELPDKIAAIAVSAGSIGGKADRRSPQVQIQNPSTPISVLIFHGKLDTHVLYDGGYTVDGLVRNRYDMSVAQAVDFWTKVDACTGDPKVTTTGHITVSDYAACTNATEVTLYTIADQGHAWPGGTNGVIDPPTHEISATALAWAFFKAHPKA
jgi:polyhydroxybutyrate depolymerase